MAESPPRPPILERLDRDPGAFRRVPVATYRVQLDHRFPFAALLEIVPYLDALGVSDVYLSPFLLAASDQSSGYDVADHNRFNPALGTETDYRAVAEALRARGMGQLVDVVPNHMGIAGSRNAWWMDVLENGPASPWAPAFDIDWDPPKPELRHKVLLPILGDHYGRVLENQELVLDFADGAFVVRYHDTVLPVAPRTYPRILGLHLEELEDALGADHPHVLELRSIVTALGHLPGPTESDPDQLAAQNREQPVVKRRLDTLVRESRPVRTFIDDNVRLLNGVRGKAESFDRLDELLGEQVYRLSFWQVAADEVNYRRFFDLNHLAAIRMEEATVFEEAHRLLLRLVREGHVTGLRIDHPDGLFAPARYFRALQRRCLLEAARGRLAPAELPPESALEGWEHLRPFYIVAEKILMPQERLPETWPVHGTTGYEFLNTLNGIFVHSAGERPLDETWSRIVGARVDFQDLVYQTKKLIMDTSMSSELAVLGHRLGRISERQRWSRDFTDRSLTEALREAIACFPVYRTYTGEDGGPVADRDRRYVERAIAMARRRNPTTGGSIYDFIRDVLCLRVPDGAGEAERQDWLTFVLKFQQLTGPITAKGLEDTAFYRYNRLVSLNEVGGMPDRFGVSLTEFHDRNLERAARWPGSLSATATHDTKRGEDVRARINVLSEIPQEWRVRLRRWQRLNKRAKGSVEGQPAPDRNEESLLYQTLLGAWPMEPLSAAATAEFTARIQRYMFKALREAKVHTSWVSPHTDYEEAVRRFVATILEPSPDNAFLADFVPFQRRIAEWGVYNSLSQTLLKLVSPGVPDVYQGTELWDLSLVDPDNRRPVDFGRRRDMLEALRMEMAAAGERRSSLARRLLDAREDGRVKLYLVHLGLTCRRAHPRLFLAGAYHPLEPRGSLRDHLCALARRDGTESVIVLAPRFLARLGLEGPPLGPDVWGDAWLDLPAEDGGATYRNVLTGEAVRVGERDGRPGVAVGSLLASFPVALLERAPTVP
jgi:(1->4)-alpha-D-glucan 1-alpha-D-glucosylmutase